MTRPNFWSFFFFELFCVNYLQQTKKFSKKSILFLMINIKLWKIYKVYVRKLVIPLVNKNRTCDAGNKLPQCRDTRCYVMLLLTRVWQVLSSSQHLAFSGQNDFCALYQKQNNISFGVFELEIINYCSFWRKIFGKMIIFRSILSLVSF